MSILNNKLRHGNFTSSEIFTLMTVDNSGNNFGAPALKYIKEKNLERKLNRSLTIDKKTRPTTWGKFMEQRVHSMLSLSYEHNSQETIVHPEIKFWSGSPDNVNIDESVVG